MFMNNMKVINRTKSGMIRLCNSCQKYNITFNNIFLELSETELTNFKKYLELTDIEYWEKEYGFNDDKAIPIPTNQHNLILVFNRTEFEEFKKLLNLKDTLNHNSLSYKDLENDFCLN